MNLPSWAAPSLNAQVHAQCRFPRTELRTIIAACCWRGGDQGSRREVAGRGHLARCEGAVAGLGHCAGGLEVALVGLPRVATAGLGGDGGEALQCRGGARGRWGWVEGGTSVLSVGKLRAPGARKSHAVLSALKRFSCVAPLAAGQEVWMMRAAAPAKKSAPGRTGSTTARRQRCR